MAAVYLHHLLRILVMGHELKYMDYPLFGQFALCVSQAEADGAERCEEPRWKLTVFGFGNQRDTDWRIRITAHCDARLRLAQFQDREEG
jgi:hypothetical protein